MTHGFQDAVSLELGRRTAALLRASPGLVGVAHENLERWSRLNADSPSLLRCYSEWQAILTQPLEAVCDLLCEETDEAQRLRQNSPFAGVLSPAVVWEIKRQFRQNATTRA